MFNKIALIILISSLFVGCATVPMESSKSSNKAKEFNTPSIGNAGLYIFRSGGFGGALKKDIWIDNECIGESAPNVFFYKEVSGGNEHNVSTESEFSPNSLLIKTESGKNYFVRQYIKMGVFVGGANVELVDTHEGEKAVLKLKMATNGKCDK